MRKKAAGFSLGLYPSPYQILIVSSNIKSGDDVIDIVTTNGRKVVRFEKAQTCSGAHPVSSSRGTGAPLPGSKAAGE
jgi:hypothetical protein